MHASSWLRALSFLAVTSLFAVGCKQAEGEPCDVDSDCQAEHFCCGADLPDFRGVCTPDGVECEPIVRPVDGGPDSGPRDAGPEAGTPPEDAGSDAGTDAGTETPDAGRDAGTPTPDAGSDAGTDAG